MRIGTLAAMTATSTKTVRFYEQTGLLPPPPRTPAGYRDYPPEAVARLVFIRDAQAAGLTLAEIGEVLTIRDSGQAPCAHVTGLIDAHLIQVDRRIAELRQTREVLQGLARRAATVQPEACPPDSVCRILTRH